MLATLGGALCAIPVTRIFGGFKRPATSIELIGPYPPPLPDELSGDLLSRILADQNTPQMVRDGIRSVKEFPRDTGAEISNTVYERYPDSGGVRRVSEEPICAAPSRYHIALESDAISLEEKTCPKSVIDAWIGNVTYILQECIKGEAMRLEAFSETPGEYYDDDVFPIKLDESGKRHCEYLTMKRDADRLETNPAYWNALITRHVRKLTKPMFLMQMDMRTSFVYDDRAVGCMDFSQWPPPIAWFLRATATWIPA